MYQVLEGRSLVFYWVPDGTTKWIAAREGRMPSNTSPRREAIQKPKKIMVVIYVHVCLTQPMVNPQEAEMSKIFGAGQMGCPFVAASSFSRILPFVHPKYSII